MDQQRLLLVLVLLHQQTDGKYFHILKTCQFWQNDLQYSIQYQYDGRLQALYNSSTEKVVGFTQYGLQFANEVNNNPHFLAVRRQDLNFYCKVQSALVLKASQDKAVPPVSRLRSASSVGGGDSEVLVCSAYDFYPRQITLTWQLDGKVIPDPPGVVVTEMPGGPWRYQIHSRLELPPNTGQDVSCMVEHAGLQEPHVMRLQLQSDTISLPVGGAVLGLGASFLFCAIGCYCKKTR
ncbi:class II histocompatibility antigen, M beta 1 chain-like [Centropristis striata]|uniref:class II histocompatibility antigen, M beta 1 chain-like n=1 Tax=Centropristis striata TaxID=184440 RepID=UPI0027E0405A|nr:class II histocompatibility antigen, M beta 1 chain-like [Centropristis striata]